MKKLSASKSALFAKIGAMGKDEGRWVTMRGRHVFISEDAARAHFHDRLHAYASYDALTFHHETPGDHAASIRARGLEGEGVFATVNRPSGFVTSPTKTLTEFRVPRHELHHVGPDMRYGGTADRGPHQTLLAEHGGDVPGADVSIARAIPPGWITKVTVHRG